MDQGREPSPARTPARPVKPSLPAGTADREPVVVPDLPVDAGRASIDFVVATYNAPPERLERTVRSALGCHNVQHVIVVDDGSTTPVEVAMLAAISGKVRVIRQSNGGPAAARNTGIEASTADLVCFIDDDDVLVADGVLAAASLLMLLKVAGVVSARIHVHDDGRTETKLVPPEWADRKLPHPSHVLKPIGLFGASGSLIARAPLLAGIRFDTDLRLGEDRDFLHKVASFGGLGVHSAPALWVAIHEGGGNLTSPAHYARRIRDHLVMLERYDDPVAREHLKEATRWLINNAAKAGVDRESWAMLVGASRARGWAVPLKALVRRVFK